MDPATDPRHRNAVQREADNLTPEEVAALRQEKLDRDACRNLTEFRADGTVAHRGADWNFPIGWKDQEL